MLDWYGIVAKLSCLIYRLAKKEIKLLAKEATKWELTALRYLASFMGILALYIIVDQDYKFLPDHNYLLQVISMATPFGFLFF